MTYKDYRTRDSSNGRCYALAKVFSVGINNITKYKFKGFLIEINLKSSGARRVSLTKSKCQNTCFAFDKCKNQACKATIFVSGAFHCVLFRTLIFRHVSCSLILFYF